MITNELLGKYESENIENYDCNRNKFNLKKHVVKYINYLEVMVSKEGEVFYANPSHTIFLENVFKLKNGITTRDAFMDAIEVREAYADYMGWLCKQTGFIAVWDSFYVGEANMVQRQVLKELSEARYEKGGNLIVYKGNY